MAESYPPPVTVPHPVYQQLRAALAAHSAEQLTRRLLRHNQPRIAHPGDRFGTVFAWMWSDNPSQAMILPADVLANLRNHNPVADLDPPVTLDELLRGLRIAPPHDFTGYDQVVPMARRDVPGYYGRDPNALTTAWP